MRRASGILLIGAAFAALLFLLARSRAPRPAETASPESDSAAITEADPRLPVSDDHPLPDPLVDPRVEIDKSRRTLTVYAGDTPVKRYRVALGSAPKGDKECEGDGRTPEGVFYACSRNPASKYHRSVGLSYPDAEDADRGLAAGMISRREHRAIVEAVRHLKRPPWNTALGGEIAIHGGGSERDWTAGCIAVTDAEAEELFNALPLGTSVRIVP